MQQLISSFTSTQNLHHAYVLEAPGEIGAEEILSFFETHVGVQVRGNPNFLYEARDTFLIEDARRLRELQLNKTMEGERKVFVISFNFITRGAQNALLKVLEEPTSGTHIFLVTPTRQLLLPTVLSRVVSLQLQSSSAQESGAVFLALSHKDRMKKVATLVKNIKDEKKSKADAIVLLQSIIVTLHADMQGATAPTKVLIGQKIKKLEQTRQYLYDQGASTKMLLEQAVLIA
jgi:DNA polymerase III delta prime subunit